MTRTDTAQDWSAEAVEHVQALLDSSLDAAGAVQGSFFDKPERRLDALGFMRTWNGIYMCAAATYGSGRWPHLAAIKVDFDRDGRLSTLVYLGSKREADLLANSRITLHKHGDDGTVLTVYARLEFRDEEPATDKRGRRSVRADLTPVRLYGIGPYVSGPMAAVPQASP